VSDVDRFRAAIARRLSLHFDDSKLALLGEVLARRMEATRRPIAEYLTRLEQLDERQELRALTAELTVGETYFFRNIDQFRALTEVALPERMAARASTRRLRLLSAGCASGEEAYSLARVLREHVVEPGWAPSIRAVDVNPAVLEKAARGRYSAWALRETPPEIRRRWFTADDRELVLDAGVRGDVTFAEHNFADDAPDLWVPESYDIIFCRNVIMYFTPEGARAHVARLTRALAPGGYLFLGHAETLRGLSDDYHLRHTHGTFYYQRKGEITAARIAAPSALPREPAVDLAWATTWVETVQRTSDRIRALSEAPASAPPPPRTSRPAKIDLGVAFELLEQERYADALALLGDLPSDAARDPDVLLLRAVLLTHGGELGAAETTCGELLQRDGLSAGAHYLLALCREGAGDHDGAADHDQAATHLDPEFAMPLLHLGLIARRAGDRDAARRDLARALVLLQREDPARLLLFGGGFGREALVALCRAELVAAGGRP
jgi:chemotaxis protein methyltransferase CheR